MNRISQGKYEILSTKAEAIDRFMQLQDICKERASDKTPLRFYCSKKGKITITNPPTRHIQNDNSTKLFAEIIEQNNKVYVSYYTEFSHFDIVLKYFFLVTYLLVAVIAIIGMIVGGFKIYHFGLFVLGLISFGRRLFRILNESDNSPKDSEILINILKNRVEIVNMWNK